MFSPDVESGSSTEEDDHTQEAGEVSQGSDVVAVSPREKAASDEAAGGGGDNLEAIVGDHITRYSATLFVCYGSLTHQRHLRSGR